MDNLFKKHPISLNWMHRFDTDSTSSAQFHGQKKNYFIPSAIHHQTLPRFSFCPCTYSSTPPIWCRWFFFFYFILSRQGFFFFLLKNEICIFLIFQRRLSMTNDLAGACIRPCSFHSSIHPSFHSTSGVSDSWFHFSILFWSIFIQMWTDKTSIRPIPIEKFGSFSSSAKPGNPSIRVEKYTALWRKRNSCQFYRVRNRFV